jgi:hypothetical protein
MVRRALSFCDVHKSLVPCCNYAVTQEHSYSLSHLLMSPYGRGKAVSSNASVQWLVALTSTHTSPLLCQRLCPPHFCCLCSNTTRKGTTTTRHSRHRRQPRKVPKNDGEASNPCLVATNLEIRPMRGKDAMEAMLTRMAALRRRAQVQRIWRRLRMQPCLDLVAEVPRLVCWH